MIGAVLCGGHSRRMGSPKALLPWEGGDLLSHAIARLSEAGFDPVCLGPADWAKRHGVPALADAAADAGPLAGVLAAVSNGDAFLIAVDMPWLTAGDMKTLAAHGAALGTLTLPAQNGMLRALCGYWPRDLAQPLADYLQEGERRVIGFADRVAHRYLSDLELRRLGIDPAHLQGLNTREQYEAALAARREQGVEP
jgi:molybdopterin-guanine dinucleotide biosynthesis protein A